MTKRNNLRAVSCKILSAFLSFFHALTFRRMHSTFHLMHLIYANLASVSLCDKAACSPFDESMHQGEMSARRYDIRGQLRDRWDSYASAFSVSSRLWSCIRAKE